MLLHATPTQGAFCSFQVVITYVAYLCARLLDLREETKAARCIQMAWRRHRLKKQLERKKVWCKKTSRTTSLNNFLDAKSTFDLIKLIAKDSNLNWIMFNSENCPVTLKIIILRSIAISLNFNHPCSLFVYNPLSCFSSFVSKLFWDFPRLEGFFST